MKTKPITSVVVDTDTEPVGVAATSVTSGGFVTVAITGAFTDFSKRLSDAMEEMVSAMTGVSNSLSQMAKAMGSVPSAIAMPGGPTLAGVEEIPGKLGFLDIGRHRTYQAMGLNLVVYADGVEVTDCYEASDIGGYARQFDRNDQGQLYLDSFGQIASRTIYGNVVYYQKL